jgi:hypothetical protein
LSDSYSGILDQEAGVIESMMSNAFAPMVLPVLFILIPIIVSVITGVTINYYFPREQLGELGWSNLAIWYPLEIWYVIRQWKSSLKNPWLTLRYWVGQKFFENDFQVIDWTPMGKINPKTKMAGTKFGLIAKPDHEEAGDLIYELRLDNKLFPKLLAAMPDVPERMFSFVGNAGLVQKGGLLFETRNIAAASFVRTDFTKDDTTEFIPIGIFNDCARVARDLSEDRKPVLPAGATLAEAGVVRDQHYASLYKRKWIDEARMRENQNKQEIDLDIKMDERVASVVDDMIKSGQVPLTGGSPPGRFQVMKRSNAKWILLGLLISGVVLWRLLVR